MSDRPTAHRPPTLKNLSSRTLRSAIGAAAVVPPCSSAYSPGPARPRRAIAAWSPARTRWPPKTSPRPPTPSSAPSSPARALRTCAPPAPPTSIWPQNCSPRGAPMATRPSGSTSGCRPPAPSTNGEQQHPAGSSDHGRDHQSPSKPPGWAAAPAAPGADRRRRRPGARGDSRVDRHRGLARSGTGPCRPPDRTAHRGAAPRAGTVRKLTSSDGSRAQTDGPIDGKSGHVL